MLPKTLILSVIVIYCLANISSLQAKTSKFKELKPVLIKSVVSHPRFDYNNVGEPQSSQEVDDPSSRRMYQFPGPGEKHYRPGPPPGPPPTQDPERGQILHRPKTGSRSSNGRPPMSNANEMSNDMPIILNAKGGKNKVKYVPTMGYQGPEKPPQVYVISNGEDEEENNPGVMGSMQTYFKSMTGRIRAAFQGLIGGITD